MKQSDDSFEQSNEVPVDVVVGLRSLGLGWEWPETFRPTWADLLELKGPQRLETFDVKSVCDATLEFLRYAPNVTFLDLISTKVTDQGMLALRYVPLLEDLWIINTNISDAGIQHLLHHRHLKTVMAFHSRVTIVGERLLNASIPGCKASKGRQTISGDVIESDGRIFRISFVRRKHERVVVSAIVLDEQREEFAEFLMAPIGRKVNVKFGEADEPNWIWTVHEPSEESAI